MKEVPVPFKEGSIPYQGRILSGVFKNDKDKAKPCDLFSQLLAEGYEVLHMGNNVKPMFFINQMQKFSPQVIILICQGNIDCIKQLIEVIKDKDLRSMARIILYGPEVAEAVRDEVHADAYAANEQDLSDMVRAIMSETFL
jgi:methanogenic corrinoid protein MtbC1